MSSRNATYAVVILVVIVIGWFLTRPKQATAPTSPAITTPSSTESATSPASEGGTLQEKNIVEVTGSGFSPADITIKVGGSVTWQNRDTVDHIVNSAVHPTHLVYPPLNLGVMKPGESRSLTFPTAGIYKYHDHLNPSLFGSITVQ